MTFNIFDVLQLLGGIILVVGSIPQLIQLWKTKSSKDLNLKTYISMSIGIGLMEIYAVNLVLNDSGMMFLITNTTSWLLTLCITATIIYLRKKEIYLVD